jgi:hypothetical protein
MQLVAGTDRLASPLSPAAPRIPDAHRILGEYRVRIFDRDDRVTFTTRQQYVAGGIVGSRAGYASLADAVRALSNVTAGDASAAVILERRGVFFGHALKGRDLEQGFRSPLRMVHLEPDARAEVRELRVTSRFERVRALVDGEWVRRFRN